MADMKPSFSTASKTMTLQHKILFVVNMLGVCAFGTLFVVQKNYEFMLYVGVIIVAAAVIIKTLPSCNYSNLTLWGMTLWAFMHMGGGSLYFNNVRLYNIMIINIVGEPFYIFKYDQLVHLIGFGTITVLMYEVLKKNIIPELRERIPGSILFVMVLVGMGFGALNEVIEFITVVIFPSTGVGGYHNTALDLVFNAIGALIAMVIIKVRT